VGWGAAVHDLGIAVAMKREVSPVNGRIKGRRGLVFIVEDHGGRVLKGSNLRMSRRKRSKANGRPKTDLG